MSFENIECPICLTRLPLTSFRQLSVCGDLVCSDCLQIHVRTRVAESRVDVSCPCCKEPIHPNELRSILDDDKLLSKYESFMVRRVLMTDPDTRWCPAPDCDYAVVAQGCAKCPKLECGMPRCKTLFCYHCKQKWHPDKICDSTYLPLVTANRRSRTGHEEIKNCPKCNAPITKEGDTCNHMTCSICASEFCWLCMKAITTLHYFGESGCTMFGTTRMSSGKRITRQLIILATAPILIPLLALITVGYAFFVVPVRITKLLLNSQFHKRRSYWDVVFANFAYVICAVMLVPPIAVIVTPLAILYTWGVVSASLCRSCGTLLPTSQVNDDGAQPLDAPEITNSDLSGKVLDVRIPIDSNDEVQLLTTSKSR